MTISPGQNSFFDYGTAETGWLQSRDPVLGEYMAIKGFIKRRVHGDPFLGLVNAVIGQQLSSKAHEAIWQRFLDRYRARLQQGSVFSVEELRECGISRVKAQCISVLGQMRARGELDLEGMRSRPEEEIFSELIRIRGIGAWTVEMVLLFSFQKKNVFSFGDLGLKKGIARLYGHEKVTQKIFEALREIYSPYGSVASLYLWEAAADSSLPGIGQISQAG